MKTSIDNIIQSIQNQGFIPMFTYNDAKIVEDIISLLYDSQIRVIEFVDRTPEAYDIFLKVIELRNAKYPDLFIGAGTIKTVADAAKFVDAGADFISCPGTLAEMGHFLSEKEVFWLPGCMTISEIMVAEQANAKMVKLVPASLLQSTFLTGIKDVFPKMKFVPMGGIDLDRNSLTPWFDAGAAAVCFGSRILGKILLEHNAYDLIKRRIARATYLIKSLKEYKQKEMAELDKLERLK